MRLCKRCIYPDTKPDLFIDEEGICSACRNYEARASVDYEARLGELKAILERYRSKDGSNYDCVVPSSGGKDSTFQALKIRELGYNPLIVTATTQELTAIGRRNIENLKEQGFDCIEVTVNPVVRRKIDRFTLETVGDISWSEHLLIFTVPVRVACQMGIPLLVWGECPQNEYGGPANSTEAKILDRRWLEEFGGLLGLRVSDLTEVLGFEAKQLIQYSYPSDEELRRVGVTGIFLGYFIRWDGSTNALYAQAHGLTCYGKTVEGSCVNYENLDNVLTICHDRGKWDKYGFGRATDLVSMAIRRGAISREDGLRIAKENDGAFPDIYVGESVSAALAKLDLTREQFLTISRSFGTKES